MMIESMAGKAGAMHGQCYDATPFKFSEDDSAIDYFGKMLVAGNFFFTSLTHLCQMENEGKRKVGTEFI